jgi:acyl-CoA synthetase (AMP-forming)/AMP-acid ligase II
MNFVEALFASASSTAPALLTEEAEHTHGELLESVKAVAGFLSSRGIARGQRVAVISENSLFGFAAYLGTMYAGAVAVPLPVNIEREQCRFILESAEVKAAFVQGKAASSLGEVLAELSLVVLDQGRGAAGPVDAAATGEGGSATGGRESFAQVLRGPDRMAAPAAVDPAVDLAALFFTSGSTSRPRGVMLTHRNLRANTRSILDYLGLTAQDRAMMVLPFYYSFGASLLQTHLAAGASLVLDKRFMFPDKVLRRMQETRCTGFAGVPSHFQVLLRRSQLKSMQFPDLKWVQQAGGKLPAHFIEELGATLPQVKIFVMYGATEATARLCYLPPEMVGRKLGSVGRAIPGVTLELLDEEGRPVPVGAVGEIVASGDNIARGYLNAPEETAASFRGGRLHTGDLARMDDEGYLHIVDRAKDFIKCAGTRTSTKAIEETLLKFPDIVEAAVLGVADDTLGEAVGVFVVPRRSDDVDVKERLLAFASGVFPPHLVPRQVHVVAALPKNNAGKVMKPALRERLLRTA